MSTKAIRELIELARSQWPQVARKAEAEAKRVEIAQETLREMFDERSLDPYPSSDGANEIVLRKFSGWEAKEDEE